MNVIVPQPARAAQRELELRVAEQVSAWHRQWLKEQYVFIPENVRFTRNANWRESFWSIQGIRDRPRPSWKGVKFMFGVSAAITFPVAIAGTPLTLGPAALVAAGYFGYKAIITLKKLSQ